MQVSNTLLLISKQTNRNRDHLRRRKRKKSFNLVLCKILAWREGRERKEIALQLNLNGNAWYVVHVTHLFQSSMKIRTIYEQILLLIAWLADCVCVICYAPDRQTDRQRSYLRRAFLRPWPSSPAQLVHLGTFVPHSIHCFPIQSKMFQVLLLLVLLAEILSFLTKHLWICFGGAFFKRHEVSPSTRCLLTVRAMKFHRQRRAACSLPGKIKT